jgi:hypothetical protein
MLSVPSLHVRPLFAIIIGIFALGGGAVNARYPAVHAPAESAAADIVESITARDLLRVLGQEGYQAELTPNGNVLWKIDGFTCFLMVMNDGTSIMFRSGFRDSNATPRKVNEWNRSRRFSRTYLDADGDPNLELDLDLKGGVSEIRLLGYLRTCRLSFTTWVDEVAR